MNDERQKEINRLGGVFEKHIQEYLSEYEPTQEVVTAAVAALSHCLTMIAVGAFGKERGLEFVSMAVNRAVERINLKR